MIDEPVLPTRNTERHQSVPDSKTPMDTTPPMPCALSGRVALVTGGAKRVGRAIALCLAKEGMDIAFTFNTSVADAKSTCQQIQHLGRRAHAIQVDLSSPNAADLVHDAFTRHFDRLDALVNNASSFAPSPLGQIAPDDFCHHMAVNALAPLLLIQRFMSMLSTRRNNTRARWPISGRVVNLLDGHVNGQPLVNHIAYNASKAALWQITKTCAIELAPDVTVNAVAPGVVAWPESASAQTRQGYTARVPLAREGNPQDAATTVLFLVRDANYCTGQVITVDGGRGLT